MILNDIKGGIIKTKKILRTRKYFDKVVKLVGGCFVIKRATPSNFKGFFKNNVVVVKKML